MNTKNLFKLSALVAVLLVLASVSAFAQTVYVDVTNGSDTYTGVNPTNSPAGTGPKASINGGLGVATAGGTVVIFAGTYSEAVDIKTASYSNLPAGSSLTLEFRTLNSNNAVVVNSFIYRVSGGTLSVNATNGTEYMSSSGAVQLGDATPYNSTMAIPNASFFQIASSQTLTLYGTSSFSNQAPKPGTNVNLAYQGGSSITAGPESNYGTFGTGTITVNKTAGTSVTLPNPITKVGGINVTSGNATFSGNVTMGSGLILNSGAASTLTFAGTVACQASSTGDLNRVVNSSTGSVVFNGPVTWTGNNPATTTYIYAAVPGSYVIDNQSTGTIAFNSTITMTIASDADVRNVTMYANNAGGTLTIGAVTATATTTNSNKFTFGAFNAVLGGTMNIAGGTYRDQLYTASGATTNVTGATTVSGVFTNAGTVALGTSVLTLNGAAAHATNGGTVTATSPGGITVTAGGSSFNGGTLSNLTVSLASGTTTLASNAVSLSNLTVTAGTVAVNIGTTVAAAGATTVSGGTVNVGTVTFSTGGFTQSGGTFTLANNSSSVLDLKGSFNRTAGTFTAGLASVTQFTGTAAQSFNGGPLIATGDLTFTNTGGVISLGQSVRVNGNCTISGGTVLSLSTLNIILLGNGSQITNTGSYTASGGGGVIFGGYTTVSGGLAATSQKILGAGVYSYITVDVNSGNDVTMDAATNVKFNGVLTLTSGNIRVNNAGGTFGPTGTSASIIRNLATGTGSDKGVYVSAGGFNTNSPANYDLQYTGAMTSSATLNTGGATGAEFTLANVNNLTFSATQPASASQSENRIEIVSAGAMTVNGNLTLTAPAANFVNQITLPSQDLTVKGAFTVASGAYILTGANPIYLASDNMTHSVAGTISIAGTITEQGNACTLNGSTVAADPATISNLAFEPAANGSSFTSNNLKVISGNLTIEGSSTKTGASATIAMNATSSTLNGNLVVGNGAIAPVVNVTIAGTTTSVHGGNLTLTNGTLTYTRGATTAASTIGGNVTLTAGTLNLGSSVTVVGTTGHADATLALGAFNYTMQGAYTHSSTGPMTGSGTLVFAYTAGGPTGIVLTKPLSYANVQVKASVKTNVVQLQTDNLTVTNSLTFTMGTFDFNALNVIVTGNTVVSNPAAVGDVTYNATGGGTLQLKGTTIWTAGDDVSLAGSLTVNGAGVTLISDKETASTPVARTWTVGGTLTLTAGNVAIGIDKLVVTGTFDRSASTAGQISMGTGYLVFNTATAFKQGTGFAVDNLEVDQNISANPVTTAFTVNKYLLLKGASTVLTANAGVLTLADGCTVERQGDGSYLSTVPTFAGAVSVVYSTTASITTAANFRELPSSVTNFTASVATTLPKPITLNGTLTLSAALTMSTTNVITMANNSTLVLQISGATAFPSAALVLPAAPGAINLVYQGTFGTSSQELGAVSSGAYTSPVNNIEFKSGTITLANNLTIAGTLKFSGGVFEVGGKTVTVQGNVNQTSATSFFTGATAATVQFTAANQQTFTLKADLVWPTNVGLKINKTNATDMVTLSGGNIDFATNLISPNFANGIFATGQTAVITLKQSSTSGQPTQGFSRTSGYVYGQVKKFIDNSGTVASNAAISIVEFPVGTNDGNYRPLKVYFKNTPQASVNVTVSHVNARPGGQNGYPIHDGALTITNYPNFYWYVKSDISLAPSYLFDMEAQAQGYADYASDGIQNLRFVRRDSGLVNNQWVEQKNNNTNTVLYDNSTIAANWPAVKVIDATGGITTQGSIFSYSQINKAPVFTAAPGNLTKNEGDTVAVTYTATDPDLGDVAVMSSVTKPTGSTFDPSTGKFTWVLGFDLATKTTPTATATVTIRATDTYGPLSKDTTVTITINNVNRPPKFNPRTVTSTVKDTDTLKVALAATDADNDALTYTYLSVAPTPTNVPAVSGTTLTWKPVFADIATGPVYTIKAIVSDGAGGTDTLTVTATVNRSRVRGDVDGNGLIQAADASVVLKHVVGIALITDPSALYAADATNNGTISALDAAYILQAAAGLITLPASTDANLSKGLTATGTLAWSTPESTKDPDVVKVSLRLSNAENVYAAQLTSQADFSLMTVEGVSAAVPQGWEMQWNVSGNELRVAMAGTTPLTSGDIAAITIRMKSKESRLNFSTDAMLNENFQSLGAVEIAAVPTVFALEQNYPNPFNPSTTIKYQIPNDANVNLVIWNLQGQKIRTLVAKEQKAGYFNVVWDGRNDAGQTVSSGFYLYRVQAGSFVAVHKMMLIK